MAKQIINIGTNANDRTGDPLRTAFDKVNSNFNELYTLVGGTSADLQELAQDYAAPLLNHNSHSGISFVYNDSQNKLIATVAQQQQVNADWNASSGSAQILNKPSIPVVPTNVSTFTNDANYVTNGNFTWNNLSGKPTIPSGDRLINGTDKVVLSEESASRLSMYVNNVEKSRLQINGNDLLLSSLAGGVVLSATDGVGGEWRFKTNGNLESTGGNFLSAAETPAVFGSLNSTSTGASSGTVTIKSGTGTVDGGSIYIEAGTGGSGNDGEVVIRTGSTPYEWLFDNGGNLNVPNNSYIKTAHDQNINIQTSYNSIVPGTTITAADSQNNDPNNYIIVWVSGSGGTDYPGIVAVQVGWTVSGNGLTNDPITNVETITYAPGMVVYRMTTTTTSAKAGYTYTFTGPNSTANITNTFVYTSDGLLSVPGAVKLGTDARVYGYGDFIGLLASQSSSAGLEIDGVSDAILAAQRHVVIRSDAGSTNKNWTFNENGNLGLPTGGTLDGEGQLFKIGATYLTGLTSFNSSGTTTLLSESFNDGGASNASVAVDAHSISNVTINAKYTLGSQQQWMFDGDGVLTFPDDTSYTGKTVTLPINQTFDFNLSRSMPPGFTNTVSIAPGGLKTSATQIVLETSGSKYWSLDSDYQRIGFSGSTGYIKFGTATKDGTGASNDIELWAYGQDNSTGAVYISAGSNPTSKRWKFNNDGHITFPDNTVQTTAAGSLSSVAQSILPASDLTYDLGSSSKQWRSLYVGANTIHIGGVALSVSGSDLKVAGSKLVKTGGTSTQFSATRSSISPVTLTSTSDYITGSSATWSGTNLLIVGRPSSTQIQNLLLLNVGDTLTITTNLGTSNVTLASAFTTFEGGGYTTYTATTVESSAWSMIQGDIMFNATTTTTVIPVYITEAGLHFEDGKIFKVVAAPAHSYGSTGDLLGHVAFDANYMYYCTRNYVDNVTNIWVRVAWSGTTW